MTTSKKITLLSSVFAMACQFFVAGTALAHHPEIVASAYCEDDGDLVITYTSTSWQTTGDPGSGNSRIDIFINGVKFDQGAYSPTTFSFSGGPFLAPTGSYATVKAKAIDAWDNGTPGGQETSTVVPYPTESCQVNGRFTGGGHQIKVDQVRVTRGLTIHCDLMLSNNLEVNWTGNQFHMTEHMTTVECSDSPLIDQFPPAAPLDTLKGVGTGRFNGEDGYIIEFTLVDAGEPGSSDQMAILIYKTGDEANPVLSVPIQVLTGGNLQAHYDQPHK